MPQKERFKGSPALHGFFMLLIVSLAASSIDVDDAWSEMVEDHAGAAEIDNDALKIEQLHPRIDGAWDREVSSSIIHPDRPLVSLSH